MVKNGDYSFGKPDRLLQRREFLAVYKKGKRWRGRYIVFIYRENSLGRSRLGLDVSRKTGKAHRRNRVKRLIREVFRLNTSRLTTDLDIIARVIPTGGTPDYREIEREFLKLVEVTAG